MARRHRGGWNPAAILMVILLMIVLQSFALFVALLVAAFLFSVGAFLVRSLATMDTSGEDAYTMGNVARRVQKELSTLDGFIRELFNPSSGRDKSRPPQYADSEDRQAVADEAMQRAGWSPRDRKLRLVDIGLLVYAGDTDPKIYRTSQIPTDSKYIRPFMVVDCPQDASDSDYSDYGGIRFNLTDGQGKLRYTARRRYALKPGQTFITPPTWLPLDGQKTAEMWKIEVLAGQAVLAAHSFKWLTAYQGVPMTPDGELDERAREWLAQQTEEPMSLDELLAAQADGEKIGSLANGDV